VAWAYGSQGGYRVAFAVFGVLAWGTRTVWYACRRGRWPSALSARLFTPPLGEHVLATLTCPLQSKASSHGDVIEADASQAQLVGHSHQTALLGLGLDQEIGSQSDPPASQLDSSR
jgi:hypothetical protein